MLHSQSRPHDDDDALLLLSSTSGITRAPFWLNWDDCGLRSFLLTARQHIKDHSARDEYIQRINTKCVNPRPIISYSKSNAGFVINQLIIFFRTYQVRKNFTICMSYCFDLCIIGSF